MTMGQWLKGLVKSLARVQELSGLIKCPEIPIQESSRGSIKYIILQSGQTVSLAIRATPVRSVILTLIA